MTANDEDHTPQVYHGALAVWICDLADGHVRCDCVHMYSTVYAKRAPPQPATGRRSKRWLDAHVTNTPTRGCPSSFPAHLPRPSRHPIFFPTESRHAKSHSCLGLHDPLPTPRRGRASLRSRRERESALTQLPVASIGGRRAPPPAGPCPHDAPRARRLTANT